MYKRMISVMIAITLMFVTVTARLFYLSTGGVQAVGASQGRYTVTVTQARGTVYDCKLRRLTNTTSKTLAVLPPTSQAVAAVTEQLGDNASDALKRLKAGKPILCEVPSGFECEGVCTFTVDTGLASDQLASHLIGYLDGDGAGVTGIQKAYNELLSACEPLKVTYTVDAAGRPLAGVEPEISGTARSTDGVVLTVDSQIQKIVEQQGMSLGKGAVIVMESQTGKLRAAASFPNFSPASVADCLEDEDAPLVNRALCAYNVGSVFKLCVCTAALRQGIDISTVYDCAGYIDIGETRFHCNKLSGHGELNMTAGLAKSCNCYFINLGKAAGAAAVYDTCVRFGFNRAYSLADGVTAAAGTLPTQSTLAALPAALANLSFGQGDLMLTPLHIAVMVAAISNGGMLVTPSAVEGTTDGSSVVSQSTAAPRRILDSGVAAQLRQMMETVVSSGTGAAAKPETGTAGGKTATAETGWYIDGRAVTQAWFAGYWDKYTIVVVREDGTSGSADCAPVFKGICDAIAEQM